MEFKRLGRTKEKISVIGLGTWKMVNNEKADIDAIRFGIKKGMTFIDTAEMYGNESMVGQAIKGMENVFLATKVAPHNFRHDDVINACNQSLKKLGVKQIDLYQLHWPNHSIPIEETMQAMEELVKEGKIRYIGVSNFDLKEFEEAQAALKNTDIVSNQVEYSILVRDIEKEFLEYSKKNKVTIIAYSPLARGALFDSKYRKLNEFLSEIGRAHKKTATQVALNWLIVKEPVVAIPKASDKEHILEDVGAEGWKLTKEETYQISHFLEMLE
jgi:diketogulonate reductase-like aldo/keto reductase